jgi:hypothetical protein
MDEFTGTAGFYASTQLVAGREPLIRLLRMYRVPVDTINQDFHVTLMYSPEKIPENLNKISQLTDRIPVSICGYDFLGADKDTLVLKLNSPHFVAFNKFFRDNGAESTWPDYIPHTTLKYGIEATPSLCQDLDLFIKAFNEAYRLVYKDIYYEDINEQRT